MRFSTKVCPSFVSQKEGCVLCAGTSCMSCIVCPQMLKFRFRFSSGSGVKIKPISVKSARLLLNSWLELHFFLEVCNLTLGMYWTTQADYPKIGSVSRKPEHLGGTSCIRVITGALPTCPAPSQWWLSFHPLQNVVLCNFWKVRNKT